MIPFFDQWQQPVYQRFQVLLGGIFETTCQTYESYEKSNLRLRNMHTQIPAKQTRRIRNFIFVLSAKFNFSVTLLYFYSRNYSRNLVRSLTQLLIRLQSLTTMLLTHVYCNLIENRITAETVLSMRLMHDL